MGSLIRLLRTGRFARALRCAHSLAPLRSFARLFCFCIHEDFTRTYTMSSLFFKVKYMKKKNRFQFFFLLLHLWRFHWKKDNVESVFKVKYMEEILFFVLLL